MDRLFLAIRKVAEYTSTGLPATSQLLSPQQSNNLAHLPQYSSSIPVAVGTQFVPLLCPWVDPTTSKELAAERRFMQNGSVIRAERQRGPDVWEFRWREPGADGKRKHRRIVIGCRAAGRPSSRPPGNSRLTGRVHSRRCVAQDEIDDSFLTSYPITVNAYSIRTPSGRHIPPRSRTRVSQQVDTAALGAIPLGARQRWRGGTLVTVASAGEIKLRQN